MCVFQFEGLDRSRFRHLLLHSPDCTKIAMQAMNENELFRGMGFHAHESAEKVDFSEPFGAILWRKRVNTGYPRCAAAALAGLSIENLIRLEMGWALPEKEKLEEVLAVMAFFYGFDPLEFFRLVKKGEEYRGQKPVDLSEYLGVELNEADLALMPPKIRKERKPEEYVRSAVRVVCGRLASGIEFPRRVIWTDGREFPIEKIDSAQEHAPFETGGTGTRFSCWLRGRQRNIGYETPGDWFVETPRFAS